jgi:hypothetical protein
LGFVKGAGHREHKRPVMSRTPAAELARLKVAFPDWSLRPVEPGKGDGFTAHPRKKNGESQPLHATTLTELEHHLWLVQPGHRRE